MRNLLPLLIAASLLAAAPAVVADDHGDRRSPTSEEARDKANPTAEAARQDAAARDGRGDASDRDDDDDDDDDKDTKSQAKVREGRGATVGAFGVTAGSRNVGGAFVTFDFDENGIENYTYRGQAVFTATVTPDDDEDRRRESVASDGSVVKIRTSNYKATAHDNPGAAFVLDPEGAYRFAFPPNVEATAQDKHIVLRFPDGSAGRLFGSDMRLDGGHAVGEKKVTLIMDEKRGTFDKHRSAITEAATRGAIGAEVSIAADALEGAVTEVVTYGNLTITTAARPGNITITLDGHGTDGRVVVVNLDPSLLKAAGKDGYRVAFDNATMVRASGLIDVLDPDDDGLVPEYHIVEDADGFQLIVSVPHYSVHTLSIADLITEVPPGIVVGLAASVLVVVGGAAVLFRRPEA